MSLVLFPVWDKVESFVLILEEEAVDALSATAEVPQVPRQLIIRAFRVRRPPAVDLNQKRALHNHGPDGLAVIVIRVVLPGGVQNEGLIRGLSCEVAANIGIFDATRIRDLDPLEFRRGEGYDPFLERCGARAGDNHGCHCRKRQGNSQKELHRKKSQVLENAHRALKHLAPISCSNGGKSADIPILPMSFECFRCSVSTSGAGILFTLYIAKIFVIMRRCLCV